MRYEINIMTLLALAPVQDDEVADTRTDEQHS